MTQTDSSTSQKQISLTTRMLIGAAIGLGLIALFLLPIRDPNPAWGKFWMIRPFIMVPFAGAVGGACNYILLNFHSRFGINRIVAMILSVIVFIFGLWIGTVLGLAGTLWD